MNAPTPGRVTPEEMAEKATDAVFELLHAGAWRSLCFGDAKRIIREAIAAALRESEAEAARLNALSHRLMDHIGDKKIALLDGVYESGYQAGFERGNPAILAAEDRAARLEAALRHAEHSIRLATDAWAESWDCSADPGHSKMALPMANLCGESATLRAALAAGGAQEGQG